MTLYELCKGKTKEELLDLSIKLACAGYQVNGIDEWVKYMDTVVEVVKGRKHPIGTRGICHWIKAVNYQGKWWTWHYILGVDLESGERIFVDSNNVKEVRS